MPCGAEIALRLVTGSVTLGDDVHEGDHVDIHVRMLGILSTDEQVKILKRILSEMGWTQRDDGTMSKDLPDGVTAVLAADGSKVTLSREGSTEVSVEAQADIRVSEKELEGAQAKADERAMENAERKLEEAKEEARAELIKRNSEAILKVYETVNKELKEATNRTTKEALTERASQLGSIESSSERTGANGTYELEIKLRA